MKFVPYLDVKFDNQLNSFHHSHSPFHCLYTPLSTTASHQIFCCCYFWKQPNFTYHNYYTTLVTSTSPHIHQHQEFTYNGLLLACIPEWQEASHHHMYDSALVPCHWWDLPCDVLGATRSIKITRHVFAQYASQHSQGKPHYKMTSQ